MHGGGCTGAGATFGRMAPRAGRDGVVRAAHATAEPPIGPLLMFGSASAAASEENACGQVNTDKARAGGSPSKGVMRRLRAAGVGSGHLCFFMSAKYWAASSAVVHMPGRGFCPPSSRPFLEEGQRV